MARRMFFTLFSLLLAVMAFFAPVKTVNAQTTPAVNFYQGVVITVQATERSEIGGYQEISQEVTVRLETGQEVTASYVLPLGASEERLLKSGLRVVVTEQPGEGEQPSYFSVTDIYRLPSLLAVMGIFLAVIIAFAGIRGLTALAGLGFSVALILYVIVPRIAQGADPMLVSLGGAFLIGGVSLYLAHGFSHRTTLSVVSTFITLALAIIAALSFVSLTKLFGLGSDESLELQYSAMSAINLRGLLLAGIIIGALGVLDDITTAQTAAVEEIHKANPKLDFSEIYQRAMSVGREHITSLVNTLALAYAGASLPMLLLFTVYQQPLWVTLNSEFVVEEVVRTVVGSLALALAVPITTFLAAAYFTRKFPIRN